MEGNLASRPRSWLLTPAAFVLAVLTTMVAAGDAIAASYTGARGRQGTAALTAEVSNFEAQATASIADGTPVELVQPIAGRIHDLESTALRPGRFFADGVRLRWMAEAAAVVHIATGEVRGVETQAEVELHQQLEQALGQLASDIPAAVAAGVDTADVAGFASDTEATAAALMTPARTGALLAAATSRDADLRAKTQAQVAATSLAEAAQASYLLAQTQAGASAALGRAQADLRAVMALGTFDVGAQAAAVHDAALALPAAQTIAQLQAVTTSLEGPTGALEAIVGVRQSALDLLAAARSSAAQATAARVNVDEAQRLLDGAQQAIGVAGSLDALYQARYRVQAVKNDLDVKIASALYAASAGRTIVVSLARQELRAIQDGVVLYTTLVGTGKPALPTPTGTFQITAKYSPYRMVSPWPLGDRYYYPPTWLKYAMLWHDGGYFIHDASWRTVWGPGANNAAYGSHGCINVPTSAAAWLYNWAPVGTTVTVVQDY